MRMRVTILYSVCVSAGDGGEERKRGVRDEEKEGGAWSSSGGVVRFHSLYTGWDLT